MTHYNTTNAEGKALRNLKRLATKQEDAVLAYFRRLPRRPFSPSEVHIGLRTQAPLTSIRRAMTDLAAAGLLTKTDELGQGPYGRLEHKWKLTAEPAPAQGRLL